MAETDVSITVGSRDNTAADFDALKARLDEIKRKIKSAGGSIDVNTAAGRLQADRLRVALDQLNKKITPEISVRGADTALLKLDAVDVAMEKLNRKTDNVFVKMSKSGFAKPSVGGTMLGLSPMLIPLAAQASAAVGAIAVSFGAAALGAGAFGLVAKSVLASAQSDGTKLQALNLKLAAATTKSAKDAVRQQITALEQGWTPAYRQVMANLETMSARWKATTIAIAAPAVATWLKTLLDGMKFLKPLLQPVADLFKAWGQSLDRYFSSPQGASRIRSIATAVGQFAAIQLADIVSFFVSFGKGVVNLARDIGASGAQYGAFGGYLQQWGQDFADWSKSAAARADVTKFMDYVRGNGHTLASIAKDLGKFIPGIFGGMTAAGTLEVKALSSFLGLLARLPPTIAKPLTEIAGAVLLLSKTGVLKVGLTVVGKAWDLLKGGTVALAGTEAGATIRAAMISGGEAAAAAIRAAFTGGGATAAGEGATAGEVAGGAAAGGGVKGLFAKLGLGGLTGSIIGGTLITALVVRPILKSISSGPGGRNWWENPGGMPGPNDKKSSGNWLTSWAPYEHLLTVDIPNWWNISFSNSIGRIQRGFHDIAHGYDDFRHSTSAVYDKIGHGIDVAWNTVWNNTIARLNRGKHDVAHGFDDFRHATANVFDGVRHDISSAWDAAWNNTIGRAQRGIHDVAGLFGGWRHNLSSWFDTTRHDIASVWDAIWNNTIGRVRAGAGDVIRGFRNLWDGIWNEVRHWPGQLWQLGKEALSELMNGAKSVYHSITSWFSSIGHGLLNAVKSVLHMSPPHPGSSFYDLGANIMTHLEHGIKSRAQKVRQATQGAIKGGPGGGSAAANEALARSMMPAWSSGNQWADWQALWTRESGWNQFAMNRGSGAFGIAQALGHGLPGTGGRYGNQYPSAAANNGNPRAQIQWGIDYIKSTYGSPVAAWMHELAAGWYDQGGWLPTGMSIAVNKTGRPERVLSHAEYGRGGGQPIRLEIAVPRGASSLEHQLINMILKYVRVQGGGDVQTALGT